MRRSAMALFLLLLASPAWAEASVRCTTYEQKSLGQLYTVCSDGTRAVSTWSPTLRRWESTVTPPPGGRARGG